jgi:dipeptidyl aminopeptidase/acylaminoacyl peptidase
MARRASLLWMCLLVVPVVSVNFGVFANERRAQAVPFTVVQEIGVAHFGDPYMLQTRAITESPNGMYIAVDIERGLLKTNRVQDELRLYSMDALRSSLKWHARRPAPPPLWTIRESTYSVGPLIKEIGWLRNSSGVTFLLTDTGGRNRLVVAIIKARTVSVLTARGQDVMSFDVRDLSHYAYTIRDTRSLRRPAADRSAASVDVTGLSLYSLVFPFEEYPRAVQWRETRGELWAATGGAPRAVLNPQTHKAVVLFQEGQWAMRLAPDGRTLETVMPVQQVPLSWSSEYLPPSKDSPYSIRPGPQNLDTSGGEFLVGDYVSVDLESGRVQPLTGAPTGASAGWWGGEMARGAWAGDGRAVILPGTFVTGAARQVGRQPCIAVVMIPSKRVQCVTHLRSAQGSFTAGYVDVSSVRFVGHGDRHVVIDYRGAGSSEHTTEFSLTASGHWEPTDSRSPERKSAATLKVAVREGLNRPPILVVANRVTHISRVIWDPNPQLKNVALGRAAVYHWQDRTGRKWVGGLYEPAGERPGLYPLVIQTHGFSDEAFRPSGVIPTAFAARSLAAAGIVVLQVGFCPRDIETVQEIPCQLAGYEAAIHELAKQGIIDPQRVGIIGFSRTVSYVMAALSDPRLRFRAASVTDGIDDGYLQYLTSVDLAGDDIERDADAVIGAAPFGVGLKNWLAGSPEFNLDKIEAPLLVVSEGIPRLLSMWEPYAGLRLLHKPVDLIVLNTEEHVLTNPLERLASQGGSVDWFRFWLQGYESPHPVMVGEYSRWEKLCDVQIKGNGSHPTSCVPPRRHASERRKYMRQVSH